MHEVYGEDKIHGSKFPNEDQYVVKRFDGESDNHYRIRQYLMDKRKPANADAISQHTKDMNPNGFWECQWSVRGIFYSFAFADELNEIENESDEDLSVCKIVSQGLIASDPRYISKVVYMLRHPRAVAKSQERLRRGLNYTDDYGNLINMADEVTVHTPEMFINVTEMAARWRLKYPEIPFTLIEFDDLVEDPDGTLSRVGDFLNKDMSRARDLVDKKLRRSIPEDVEHDLWEDAEYIYEKFKLGEYQNIIDYLSDRTRAYNRSSMSWSCPRTGRGTNEAICKVCMSNSETRENFIKSADQAGIDWVNEPCPYECGLNLDMDRHLTIEESTRCNFWLPESAWQEG
jgi:hypothetical protein